jgi:hypothetical protein
VIGVVLWLAALLGGAWALERMRKRRGELTDRQARRRR